MSIGGTGEDLVLEKRATRAVRRYPPHARFGGTSGDTDRVGVQRLRGVALLDGEEARPLEVGEVAILVSGYVAVEQDTRVSRSLLRVIRVAS